MNVSVLFFFHQEGSENEEEEREEEEEENTDYLTDSNKENETDEENNVRCLLNNPQKNFELAPATSAELVMIELAKIKLCVHKGGDHQRWRSEARGVR